MKPAALSCILASSKRDTKQFDSYNSLILKIDFNSTVTCSLQSLPFIHNPPFCRQVARLDGLFIFTMSIKFIQDLDTPELQIYLERSENRLRRIYEPEPGLFIAESLNVIERALAAGYEPVSFLLETKLTESSEQLQKILEQYPDVPAYLAPLDVINHLVGYSMMRGALCAMRRKHLPSLEEACAGARRLAVLENVVNPINIGAIVRSAAAMHVDAILFTAGCSDPLYRRAIRVSMGTIFQIPWTILNEKRCSWPEKGMAALKEMGYMTAAMALSDDSVSIDDPCLQGIERLAIILGSEGEGLLEETIRMSDYTVKIPMSHGVDSLNVAAASAVAFWQLR